MLKRSLVFAALVLAAVTALVSASAHAFPADYNFLTFRRPVALPGVTLSPGTYRFEIANGTGTRDVVRVSARHGGLVYYQGLTLRIARPRGPRQAVVTFGEARAGSPLPIRAWFPIDAGDGRQFIY